MIIAATGHRPDKLGGYGRDVETKLKALALRYLRARMPSVTAGISGMATGWDTAWALALLELKIPLIAAVPFVGQEKVWPVAAQERYRRILRRATRVEVICVGGFMPGKLQVRNEWMVDHCDRVAALWDGKKGGGTANCIAYAAGRKPIDHLWEMWNEDRHQGQEAAAHGTEGNFQQRLED